MLVGFIGAPGSGKTTAAARLFATLKEMGIVSELIVEEARRYIAQKRSTGINTPVLDDHDQYLIMLQQLHLEELMLKTIADPSVVVVSDSSPLNSLLYMSEQARTKSQIRKLAQHSVDMYDIAFLCGPIPHVPNQTIDMNRIHSLETAKRIDASIPEILKQMVPALKTIPLVGDTRYRQSESLKTVLEKLKEP